MDELDNGELARVVELQHACHATFAQTVPVRETFQGAPVWEGVVHVFNIDDHPRLPVPMRGHRQSTEATSAVFYAVLQIGAIKTPVDAVRAAIVTDLTKF